MRVSKERPGTVSISPGLMGDRSPEEAPDEVEGFFLDVTKSVADWVVVAETGVMVEGVGD